MGSANGGIWVHNAGNCNANRAAGKLWESELAATYKKLGYTVIQGGKGSGVSTPKGMRFPDLALWKNGKFITYVEAKVGSSPYIGTAQQTKDQLIKNLLNRNTIVRYK